VQDIIKPPTARHGGASKAKKKALPVKEKEPLHDYRIIKFTM